MRTEKINVGLCFGGEAPIIEVGELILKNKQIHFKYSSSFTQKGFNLSPLKLPFNTQIQSGNPKLFDGLFGLFYDSLPDNWGKLLLDRAMLSKGINTNQLNPLDRLSLVGLKGAGALVYHPCPENTQITNKKIQLDKIANETKSIISGASSSIIEALYELGGSSGGARPKIQLGFNKITQELIYPTNELPNGFEHWLIKFPSSFDLPDIANIEFAYYLMAKDAGIEISESKLFTGKSNEVYFGTKRFDRIGNKRLHLHSASGLLHDDFEKSQLDYGHLMDAVFQLERNENSYGKILRLAAFNLYSHNRDDHSKNFSFLMAENGEWEFAPAYDLTFSSSSHGYHSTLIGGESLNPNKSHLLELASVFGVRNTTEIIEEVKEVIRNWTKYANNAGVSSQSKKKIKLVVDKLILT